jgi:hypothetical protein
MRPKGWGGRRFANGHALRFSSSLVAALRFEMLPLVLGPHHPAELLGRIFQVDPLACPRCGEVMRIVAFVTEPQILSTTPWIRPLRRTRA